MSDERKKSAVVVLAAGHGKRMKSELPKVLHKIGGRPLVQLLLQSIKQSGVAERPLIVVSGRHTLVQEECGANCDYAVQEHPLGTGHAVLSAESLFKERADFVCVLYADSPLIKSETIKKLCELAQKSGAAVAMATAVFDPSGPFSFFSDFGRILRNESGRVTGIREKKDCTPEELLIREVNSGFYCFDARWLWPALRRLDKKNVQGEYYLTDLIGLAIQDGRTVAALPIPPEEAVGINTPEQLAIAEKILTAKF